MHTTDSPRAAEKDPISPAPIQRPSKRRIAHAFGLKASTYETHAVMQAHLISLLLPLISSCATNEGLWADLGCGTGLLERVDGAPAARRFGLDLAFEPLLFMRRAARHAVPAVQADIEALPFKPGALEGVTIASVLQWLSDPVGALRRISAILIPDGRLVFSAFVSGSFFELFETLAAFGLQAPVVCPTPERLTEDLSSAGFAVTRSDIVQQTIFFPDARTALKSLSGMGAAAREGKRMTRRELERFCADYERRFRSSRGAALTYRAMIGICRKEVAR